MRAGHVKVREDYPTLQDTRETIVAHVAKLVATLIPSNALRNSAVTSLML